MIALRAKLAVSSIVVLAAGLALLIWFSMMGIQHYLMSGIDNDLNSGRESIERTGMTRAQLSAIGTLVKLPEVLEAAGFHGNTFAMLDAEGNALPLSDQPPDALQRALAAAAREPGGIAAHRAPFDISVGGEDYRAAVARLADGEYVLLARSTRDAGAVVSKVVHLELTVGGVLVVLLGAFIYFGARWRLQPLEDMVETASGIAEGGPDRPDLSARVAPRKSSFREVEQLRTALNAMLQQVESAFETREHAAAHLKRFVADASHELRTPLAAIRGYLQLYEKGMLTTEEEERRALARMNAEAERMARLVDELLALARLDQRPRLQPRPVDLARVVRGAAADLSAQQPDRRLHLDLPDAFLVLADEATLCQIVANLLANVRAHTPVSADVHVSVSGDADSGVVQVRDEGPGMRPQDADRIFDRFFRAARDGGGPANAGASDAGSGLGMAVVHAATAANGGTVRVDTAPGQGLTVTVELPAATDAATLAHRPPKAVLPPRSPTV
ncbi:sensor histidine kinase [Yinghuangia seranimata]|uniref:sensor histidine kinase n=1 Tax=Yinghuangia seranimata TaxID=408067 RepID=UPI00248C9C52|nr:HAMP domain-containing sensor histidine kinase [Yinghuangia seranimata]MDI2124717.1 HAMP domain-containing sensor histidine kinase [Yinghuangia seranimata]